MSLLVPCSACGERAPGKLANCTFAYWNAANERSAWRQHLCIACYASQYVNVLQAAMDAPLACPMCHSDPGEQLDPCYVTLFLPTIGKSQHELATCAPCAVELRNRAQVGARKLDDRRLQSGGQDPGPQTDTAANAWAQLGITPRE